uniref:Uncharacterized protein n=1 Tax=Anguilla anguilla TaxID=7936 RepID=A0A0E9T6Z8_ANGAN
MQFTREQFKIPFTYMKYFMAVKWNQPI